MKEQTKNTLWDFQSFFYVLIWIQTDLHSNRQPCKCSFMDNRKTHRCPVHVNRENTCVIMYLYLFWVSLCVSLCPFLCLIKHFKAFIKKCNSFFHAFPISNKLYHTTSERGKRICLIWVDISEPSKRFSTIPITQDGQLCIHSAIRSVFVNKNLVVITQLSASVPDQMK